MQKLWDNALVGAVENVRKGGTEGSVEIKQAERKYSKRDAADDAAYIEEAKRYFGTTADFREAGYLLTDGKMLNFSGTHEGGTERGVRYVDHRDIWDVRQSDDFSVTEAMVDFMNAGNIRLMDESGGINLQQAPTKAQEAVLKRFVERHNGYVVVDVDNEKGNTVHTFEYDKGTSGTRVINDIRAYYADGTIPTKQSGIGNFLYDDVKYSKRAGVEFMEAKYYAHLIDQIEEQKQGGYIKVGKVLENSILHDVGMPVGDLYFDNSKINRILSEHAGDISKEVLQQVPEMLRKPVVIVEDTRKDNIDVFGDVWVNNSPVLVGVVVTRNAYGKNVVNKIRTVHPRRDTAAKISDKTVLYIGEDKKRTQNWFQTLGTHLPLGGTKFGFIRSIAQPVESVKQSPRRKAQLTNREILVNAFGYVSQDNAEYELLGKYRKQIGSLNEKEAQRKRVQEAIREKMLSEGVRNGSYRTELNRLRSEEKRLANEIDRMDRKLLNLERAKPLKDIQKSPHDEAHHGAKVCHKGAWLFHREPI